MGLADGVDTGSAENGGGGGVGGECDGQLQDFLQALESIAYQVESAPPGPYRWETAEEMAMQLAGAARRFLGVGCERCAGAGMRAYGSTSTWRGGIGGQMITPGVCDACWGSGRTDRHGPNLRNIESMQRRLATLEANR